MNDSLLKFFNIAMDRYTQAPIPQDLWDRTGEGLTLNVGAGKKSIPGALSLDLPEWNADTDPIPFDAETVNGIHCYHFLEHVRRPVEVLMEFQRVLRPGGVVMICVPYYSAQCAAQDLDHKTQWCEETWRNLFANPYYDTKGKGHDWQLIVRTNMIMGLKERNLVLMTQLVKYH